MIPKNIVNIMNETANLMSNEHVLLGDRYRSVVEFICRENSLDILVATIAIVRHLIDSDSICKGIFMSCPSIESIKFNQKQGGQNEVN